MATKGRAYATLRFNCLRRQSRAEPNRVNQSVAPAAGARFARMLKLIVPAGQVRW